MKVNKYKNLKKLKEFRKPSKQCHSSYYAGSFEVHIGNHLRFGIICSPVWGSFLSGDHLQPGISQRSNDWARARFTHFRLLSVTFPFHHTKFPWSTSFTRAISVPSPIILPLQTFCSRVLLLRQEGFSSGNLPPKSPTTTAIKTQVFMSRYERKNSTRKFTIVVEIVSLLKEIFTIVVEILSLLKELFKRDASFRAVFKQEQS